LRLVETTIDHQLPESLLYDDAARAAVFVEYGLPTEFNINGYENWLPCHNHCNQEKGPRHREFVPGIKAILDRLRSKANEVRRAKESVDLNIAKDRVFKTIFAALEKRTITLLDLDQLLQAFVRQPANAGVSDDVILLDSGHWVPRDSIVYEGTCGCERPACVGRKNKIYCYSQRHDIATCHPIASFSNLRLKERRVEFIDGQLTRPNSVQPSPFYRMPSTRSPQAQ
jgi:hypothetical protein